MAPVQLYVYDLSNGLARSMSRQMIGRQIDGIWHTSVVVFGKETFYGQGINQTLPGRSHHGRPVQIIDMGETAIDQETFEEYINEIRDYYTADKYHLLDFNCNSFTNDCIGFLTGGSIPPYIKDLPADFLSTPFGASLRPTIDAMYRRPPSSAPTPVSAQPDSLMTSALLESVASQAAGSAPSPATSTLTAPLQVCTNPASLHSLLASHKAVAIFVTSQTCAPCRIVAPVFEDLARDKASPGIAFVKVDMSVGRGGEVAGELGAKATPTFLFFLDGKKIHQFAGANAAELKTQVDLLIYQAFPPHPHTALNLPNVRAISLNPILYEQVPALDAVINKLTSFVDALPPSSTVNRADTKATLNNIVKPFMKTRFSSADKGKSASASALPTDLVPRWSALTKALAEALPPAELFPIIDLWRLGLLDERIARAAGPQDVTGTLIRKTIEHIDGAPRNLTLTALRMAANAFAHFPPPRETLNALLVPSLLHSDASVRTAAASLAFNVAVQYQKPLVEQQRSGKRGDPAPTDGGDEWEMEIVSALVESLARETQSEEVVHRLVASLAFLIHLSPFESQISSLLEVLQARDTLRAKLAKGGCGETGVTKAEVKKLIEEVATKLCP